MRTYLMRVMVRKRGAIGVFYEVPFTLQTTATDLDGLIADWQTVYGITWELHHVVSWEEQP
jgi:hypothetical protein